MNFISQNKNKMNKSLILTRIKTSKGFKTDKELAEFLDIKSSTLSNWYSRNAIDFELVFTKCEDLNADYLIFGRGNKTQDSDIIMEPTSEYHKKSVRESELEYTVSVQKEYIELLKKEIKKEE